MHLHTTTARRRWPVTDKSASDALAAFCAAQTNLQKYRVYTAAMRHLTLRQVMLEREFITALARAEETLAAVVASHGGRVVVDGVCLQLELTLDREERRRRPRVRITYGF